MTCNTHHIHFYDIIIFLYNRKMNKNNVIQEKILNILNNPPTTVGVLETTSLSYDDIYNIWNYFRINNQDYLKKYGITETNWTDEQHDYYKRIFNNYNIFDKIFKNHIKSDKDHLLLFYSMTSGFFYCKFKSINSINPDIINKFKENAEKLNIDTDVSLFWNIDLHVKELKKDFDTIYTKANIDKRHILLIQF